MQTQTQTHSLMDQLAAHVKHGDHICVVCENAEERLNAAAQYIADGLRQNEFVMYAADVQTTRILQSKLAAAGIDVEHEIARGALNLPTAYDAYLTNGQFDPDAMYVVFEQAIANALAAGYSGCRFAGEPIWAIDREELRPGLIEFEARLNQLFKNKKAAGLCVYDKQAWPATVVRDILRTHPVAVVDDLVCKRNIYYERPDLAEQDVTVERQVGWMLTQLRELQMHETRLQVALDAGRLGSWELDVHSDTSERSSRHDEIFGYDRPVADWGYARFMTHVVPEDRDQVKSAFEAAITNGTTCRITCRIRRHGDGALRWIEAHGRPDPLGSSGARVQRMLGIVADITERKEMEQALRDNDRRKDEFLATLAHELRNPLAPIFNALHLMQMKYADDPQLQRLHGVIDRQAHHLSRLVDDLLDVSRITTGRIVLQRQPVDLRAILASAVEAVQPLIDTAQHAFSLAVPAEPVLLEGDPTRLAQVFLNILSNAAKYTPKHGQIALNVELDVERVLVKVRDNGIGLDPAMIPHMFEMFVQGHRIGDRAHGGLGIGLSLARQLVELHGGAIEARSAGLGQGSEFIVTLPLAAATAEANLDAPQALRAAGCRRVLVVDDNVDAADTLASSLAFVGHEVKTCYDGAGALEVASQWTPEVAILDIGMPGIDGYELARRLRRLAPGATLIALTGWGQENDLRQAREAGFDIHRTKPVNLPALLAQIAAAKKRDERPVAPGVGSHAAG